MEREYICRNGIRERVRFLVGDTAKPRGKKQATTSDWKQLQNEQAAMRQVARILNCNASKAKGSLLITLSYAEPALERLIEEVPEELRECVRAAMRREGAIGEWRTVKRHGKRTGARPEMPEGLEDGLYYLRKAANADVTKLMRKLRKIGGGAAEMLVVVSDMDGETGEPVRIHCHLVLMEPGEISPAQISKAWGNGDVDLETIRAQKDYTPVAVYLMRQARRKKSEAKYRCSRGLERPVVQDRVVTGRAEMRIPAGAQIMEHPEYHEGDAVQYARYFWPKKERKVRRDGTLTGEKEDIPDAD